MSLYYDLHLMMGLEYFIPELLVLSVSGKYNSRLVLDYQWLVQKVGV